MEELELTVKDINSFVPFDEWNLQLLKQSRMRENEVIKIKNKEECKDIKCGSYSKCDKVHCHQFYEYTDKGIIKRD